MELRHFTCFVAVAEERSFTRAAARLHVVQSAVSASIKSLEHELGAPLLQRSSRHLSLTDAGAAFLPKAQAALDDAQAAVDAVDDVRGGLRGMVRIGTMGAATLIDLPALLGDFHRLHPDVSLQLTVAPSGPRALIEAVKTGRLDLAFVAPPGPAAPGIALRELAAAPLELVVPATHRLAGRPTARIEELAGEPFVDFPPGYGNRDLVDRAFAAANVPRSIIIEVPDLATGADFVLHQLGIAILPRFFIPHDRALHVMGIDGIDMRWPLTLATCRAREPTAATRALLGMLDSYVPDTPGYHTWACPRFPARTMRR
jgi:DNA-binding transcriptional LysR family regulator